MREDLETKYSRIGDFCKKEKKKADLAENFSKNSAFCLFKSWECGSHRYLVGLTRAHSGSLGMLVFRINFSKFSAL